MIKGMTGFGSVQFSTGEIKGSLEIKSQNHRYFDLVYYLPVGFASIEKKIKDVIQKDVQRGRVIVALKITEKPGQNVQFNRQTVRDYLVQAQKMSKEFRLDNNLTLSDLIRLPGVLETRETVCQPDNLWPAVEVGLKKALRSLVTMRKAEGRSLAKDFNAILRRMIMQIKKIEARTKGLAQQKKKILTPEEYTSWQKGMEISEELTRLKHYIDEFKALVSADVLVGKKMDFVAQEMQRETNTIGSKVQDNVVSNAVIALKSKIEKLREQAQNIE